MFKILNEHHTYLADRVRLESWERALRVVVKPGAVAVDLGAGTGILGLLACRCGAARVHVIDKDGILGLACELAAANGVAERMRYYREHSSAVELPERADVVFGDQVGYWGFQNGYVEYFSDACRRFLKPGGIVMPATIDLMLAPVHAPASFAWVEFWSSRPAGFDFTPARERAHNACIIENLEPGAVAADPVRVGTLDPAHPRYVFQDLTAEFAANENAVWHGLGGWVEAHLAPGVTMTNAPVAHAIDRRQIFLPFAAPLELRAGSRVRAFVDLHIREDLLSWRIEILAPGANAPEVLPRQSTFQSLLLAPEDLARTRSGYRPSLSPRGAAIRDALTWFDGGRTPEEIAQALRERHPAHFPEPADALTFVTALVRAHGR